MIDLYDLLYYEAFGSYPKDYEKQKKEYYKSYKERQPMKDDGIVYYRPDKPAGFPVALIVQIILAIISYLLTKATAKTDKEYLVGLSKELREKTGVE